MSQIIKQRKVNLFDPVANSNKVWIGIAYADGKFESRWGRVLDGGKLSSKVIPCGTASAAERMLEGKHAEKIRKGYRDSGTIDGSVEIKSSSPVDLQKAAFDQIKGAEEKTTAELIKYLAEVNIHNITGSTSIKYDAANATFSTPLGVLSPDAVREARALLGRVKAANSGGNGYPPRDVLVRDYFQLVPKDFGMRIPCAKELLSNDPSIQKENDILDALEAAFSSSVAAPGSPQIFKCRLAKIPHWTEEGKAAFRRIRRLFEATKNAAHGLTAGLRLQRIYEVEIEEMKEKFDRVAARIGNVREDLWHGTKASNLLSILKNGLIIPPASSAHCTGRMFGNGIYTSNQSTKALNYATNMWNRSGASDQRRFMFLCDVALGKTFKPVSSGMNFPAAGSDSTWVEPGTAGVLNHECIVYDTAQINLRYLCEFGEA